MNKEARDTKNTETKNAPTKEEREAAFNKDAEIMKSFFRASSAVYTGIIDVIQIAGPGASDEIEAAWNQAAKAVSPYLKGISAAFKMAEPDEEAFTDPDFGLATILRKAADIVDDVSSIVKEADVDLSGFDKTIEAADQKLASMPAPKDNEDFEVVAETTSVKAFRGTLKFFKNTLEGK